MAEYFGVNRRPVPDAVSFSEDHVKLQQILDRMREEEFDRIWIWVASNAQDVSGYYWLISQLSEFAGRIDVLSLNNLPFISDKGTVFYPSYLSEIPPREFIKAKKLARPVSLSEFETDPDEWTKLSNEHKNVRILEGAKKLVQQEDDFFDASLKKFLSGEFQKTSADHSSVSFQISRKDRRSIFALASESACFGRRFGATGRNAAVACNRHRLR